MTRVRPAPALDELLARTPAERIKAVLAATASWQCDRNYPHWEELRRRPPPANLSHEEWWLGLKLGRRALIRPLPLTDANGRPFGHAPVDAIQEMLHQIDQRAAGTLGMPDAVVNPETRDRYVVSSLIEEAITSSQLEGAATTRRIAVEMLRSGRPAADQHERMIRNNYEAIQYVRRISTRPLTGEDVLELHRITTTGTLRDPTAAGRLQTVAESRVNVVDRGTEEILHVPPPAEQLPARLQEMVRFANGETPGGFLHPVVRAVLLHFWLAYDHPFEDGNGRTARALFYWAMLRNGYWLAEFLSISTILRRAHGQYGKSFLYSESDENDATYFVIHQLEVILKAIRNLDEYLRRKSAQLKEVEQRLRDAAAFNHRQRALLAHALRHPGAHYTIRSQQRSHDVAYATARADLLSLVSAGLLTTDRMGKATVFRVPADLERRMSSLARHRGTTR